MPSGLFRINSKDFLNGLVASVGGAIYAYISAPTFDVAAIDWKYLLNMMVAAFFGYLGKRFLTDENGVTNLGVVKIPASK